MNKLSDFWKKIKLKTIKEKISVSFYKCCAGEESLKVLLWYWSLIPNILGVIVYYKLLLGLLLFKILLIVYSFMCVYFILKAVKIHPEYNVSKIAEQKEKEYKLSLTKDELKKYKKERAKQNQKDFIQKLLLNKPWKVKEFYKTTLLILALVILILLTSF